MKRTKLTRKQRKEIIKINDAQRDIKEELIENDERSDDDAVSRGRRRRWRREINELDEQSDRLRRGEDE